MNIIQKGIALKELRHFSETLLSIYQNSGHNPEVHSLDGRTTFLRDTVIHLTKYGHNPEGYSLDGIRTFLRDTVIHLTKYEHNTEGHSLEGITTFLRDTVIHLSKYGA